MALYTGDIVLFMGIEWRVSYAAFMISERQMVHSEACNRMDEFIPFPRSQWHEIFGLSARVYADTAFPEFRSFSDLEKFVKTVNAVYDIAGLSVESWIDYKDVIERRALGMNPK